MRPLEQAVALIRAVVDDLDTESSPCECCARETYQNWTHYQAARELASVIRKIERWDTTLSEPE